MTNSLYTFCKQCANSLDGGETCNLGYSCIQGSEFVNKYEEQEILDLGFNTMPDCCKNCCNNPKNGGSGICNCTIPNFSNPMF